MNTKKQLYTTCCTVQYVPNKPVREYFVWKNLIDIYLEQFLGLCEGSNWATFMPDVQIV